MSVPMEDSFLSENQSLSQDFSDGDIMKIMISTDCHLGFEERDQVRGLDSFAAFEEVLLKGKENKVDFVLLAGDLFHDSKPSRSCIFKAMSILRKHCMGDEPIHVKILGEQAMHFPKNFGWANYEDENYNIGLAVFSIHGNHDDPGRDGGGNSTQVAGPELCTLDLLHCAGLVNYFGQCSEVDQVIISPILLQKGKTKLAMYGLGNMRDERLTRMWKEGRVKFQALPKSTVSKGKINPNGHIEKEWFNIFVLHQNRAQRMAKNYVREELIPEWMDLVVWGHEHECKGPSIEESLVGSYRILQPGSTVATSLVPGEAKPKYAAILNIKEDQFKVEFERLTQVRPLIIKEVFLSEIEGLNSEDDKIEIKLTDYLSGEVDCMIEEAISEARRIAAVLKPSKHHEFTLKNPEKVLVRLVVEHTGFGTLTNSRFGERYIDKVANAGEMLLFKRTRKVTLPAHGRVTDVLLEPIQPDELGEISVEDLVQNQLDITSSKMQVLLDNKLATALEEFVDKQDTSSIPNSVVEHVGTCIEKLYSKKKVENEAIIQEELMRIGTVEREKANQENAKRKARLALSRFDDDFNNMGIKSGGISQLLSQFSSNAFEALERSAVERSRNIDTKFYEEDADMNVEGSDTPSIAPIAMPDKGKIASRGRGRGRGRGKEKASIGSRGSKVFSIADDDITDDGEDLLDDSSNRYSKNFNRRIANNDDDEEDIDESMIEDAPILKRPRSIANASRVIDSQISLGKRKLPAMRRETRSSAKKLNSNN